MKRIWILLLGFALVWPAVFNASQANALTLIPPSLEFGVKPGETLTTKVKLFNESATATTLYATTDNFTAGDETGTPKFTDTPTEDIAGWIKVSRDPIQLAAGARLDVPLSITVPANADPGGHYGVVFFGDRPTESANAGVVAVGNKIGTLILVRVEGSIQESGTITGFSVERFGSTTRLPVGFNIDFQNTGNVHVRPVGSVTIRNVLGGTTVTLPVNEKLGAVLPTSERRFSTLWEKETNKESRGNFFQEIGAEWSNFALGPYTATLDLSYGLSNDKMVTSTVQFIVIPWHLLLTVILVLGILVVAIIWAVRRYNRWIISRAQQKT